MQRRRRSPEGVPIVLAACAAAAAMLAGAGWAQGWSEAGVRLVVRATAKVGVTLFGLAFAASSLRVIWRSPFSAWLLRNRRYLGLSFAVFHFLHLAALVALGAAFPSPFLDRLTPVTLVGGGLAYAFLLAMVLTSTDAAAARLGRRRWSRLHTLGSWYIWIVFAQSYGPRAFESAVYLPFAGWLAAVAGLRAARALRSGIGRRAVDDPGERAA